jgi:hypothetical protein
VQERNSINIGRILRVDQLEKKDSREKEREYKRKESVFIIPTEVQ